MFRTTTFAGISFTSQRNRRILVVVVYLLVAVLVLGSARSRDVYLNSGLWIIVAFSVISRGVFGVLVSQQTIPIVEKRRIESRLELELSGKRPSPKLDERDLLQRNSAYFVAFRIVATYALLVWFVDSFLRSNLLGGDPGTKYWLTPVLQVVLIVLVFTLPQALILWNEPDVVAEQ